MADNELDALAKKVISGDYGDGDDRKEQLGDKYYAVQNRVNEMLGNDFRYDLDDPALGASKEFSDIKTPTKDGFDINGLLADGIPENKDVNKAISDATGGQYTEPELTLVTKVTKDGAETSMAEPADARAAIVGKMSLLALKNAVDIPEEYQDAFDKWYDTILDNFDKQISGNDIDLTTVDKSVAEHMMKSTNPSLDAGSTYKSPELPQVINDVNPGATVDDTDRVDNSPSKYPHSSAGITKTEPDLSDVSNPSSYRKKALGTSVSPKDLLGANSGKDADTFGEGVLKRDDNGNFQIDKNGNLKLDPSVKTTYRIVNEKGHHTTVDISNKAGFDAMMNAEGYLEKSGVRGLVNETPTKEPLKTIFEANKSLDDYKASLRAEPSTSKGTDPVTEFVGNTMKTVKKLKRSDLEESAVQEAPSSANVGETLSSTDAVANFNSLADGSFMRNLTENSSLNPERDSFEFDDSGVSSAFETVIDNGQSSKLDTSKLDQSMKREGVDTASQQRSRQHSNDSNDYGY